jgi:hypothetical protein
MSVFSSGISTSSIDSTLGRDLVFEVGYLVFEVGFQRRELGVLPGQCGLRIFSTSPTRVARSRSRPSRRTWR